MIKPANIDPSNYTSQEVLIYNAQETESLFQSLDLINNNWRTLKDSLICIQLKHINEF